MTVDKNYAPHSKFEGGRGESMGGRYEKENKPPTTNASATFATVITGTRETE